MEGSACVLQEGTVEEVSGSIVRVRVHRESACGACHAKNMCVISEKSEQLIEVERQGHLLKKGDSVQVSLSRSTGNMAVFMGYFIPFILLITVLTVSVTLGLPEWMAGLLALGGLVPYYILLSLWRRRIKRVFRFNIHKNA
jgi:sigma-E factor negative regulatory protein RseC